MTRIISRGALALLLGLALAACHRGPQGDSHEHGAGGKDHAHDTAEAQARGPHGGRLLRNGTFTLELAIVEDGVPPTYRAWASAAAQPVAPADVKLEVELGRLDGEINRFTFAPDGDALAGNGVVAEPHSFTVQVRATHAGATHAWNYDSFEGRTTIAAASAQTAGIIVAPAGARLIRDVLPLYGRIGADPEAVRDVTARFPGIVRKVGPSLGDIVRAGEVLANVESNDSLQVYAVTAPIGGTVTARNVQPGEHAGSEPLFTISDLSKVGAELSAFPRDLSRLAVGQTVRLRALDGERSADTRIVRLTPATGAGGAAMKVWARLDTADASWTPGLPVDAQVLTGGAEVPLAIPRSALQAFRDFTVAFARIGETYEVRMLELGRSDGEYVEVLSGLKPGTEIVVGNSFLVKADIEKSGASHDH